MKLSSIEIRHLRYFVAIAEAGSLSAAALQLHISQPPLTRQVRQLEELLEVEVFKRRPNGVELTKAGEAFLVEANNILTLIEQATIRTKQMGKGLIGRIDVGIFGSAIYGVIPEIIRSFRVSKPGVEIVLHNMERTSQLRALRERRITVGFNRFFGDEPDLQWERVHSEHMNLALYSEHPLATKGRVKLSEIVDEPLILYPKKTRPSFLDYMLKAFYQEGISPNIAYEVDDVNTAVALASSGMGISIVTDSACNLKLPNICYVPLEFTDITPFDLDIIYRIDDTSELLSSFLDVVRKFGMEYNSNRS